MFEATFEIQVDGLLASLAREHDAEVRLWCNDHSDLLHVRSPELPAVTAALRETVGLQESIRDGDKLVVVTDDCLKGFEETLLETHLASNGCLSLPPLTYDRGKKRATVLALDSASLTSIYDDLRAETRVTVRSKREIHDPTPEEPVVGVDDVFPQLTDKQRSVFRIAYEGGYYEIPRGITTSEIAAQADLERRTAEDHLRRAEKKVADALADNLSLLRR
jgi:predicted DNA binding protein